MSFLLLLYCIMLMPLVNTWWAVQSSLFLPSFLMIMFCHHDFSNYMMGWCFSIDSLGYIFILSGFWITAFVVCSSQKVLGENNYPSLFLLFFFLFYLLIYLFSLLMTFSVHDYLLF